MGHYKSKTNILLLIDIVSLALSFLCAINVRYDLLVSNLGSYLITSTYVVYFAYALIMYVVIFLVKKNPGLETMSYREIILSTLEQQIVFVAAYVMLFFLFHQAGLVSRVVVVLFFGGNVVFISIGRILYHKYCIYRSKVQLNANRERDLVFGKNGIENYSREQGQIRHVYIIGSKSLGLFGGFESFVRNLLSQFNDDRSIKFHVACKANGDGFMELSKLPGVIPINDNEFIYSNAHCFMVPIIEKLGSAQAIYYDIKAFEWCCRHIEDNHIYNPMVYILASRIGPFVKGYVARVHAMGGIVANNNDGIEYERRKWNWFIRKYWRLSERLMVKHTDLMICDNDNIKNYIEREYSQYNPRVVFIPYGTYIKPSCLSDDDPKYKNWLDYHGLTDGNFYISVGRLVPENNFYIMIREFMASDTKADFAIIATDNPGYMAQLSQKLSFSMDKRIRFVGTVYDMELITKIRERARGYIHGHSVGGTNPSLLESLASTPVNLVYDVCFNREVAGDAALYFSDKEGSLKDLIDRADSFTEREKEDLYRKGVARIRENYSWPEITKKYKDIFI